MCKTFKVMLLDNEWIKGKKQSKTITNILAVVCL